jgi:hypothetical protein
MKEVLSTILYFSWGNTFPMGNTFNSRPIQRMGVKTSPKPPVQQQQQGGMQWSFGAKRSLVGGTNSTGHLQLQRNNSHNTAVFSRPGIVEVKPLYEPPHDKTNVMRLRPAWIQTSRCIRAV